MKRSLKNGKWCFSFDPPFDLQPKLAYQLQFSADGRMAMDDQLSKQRELNYMESIIFKLIGSHALNLYSIYTIALQV